MTARGAQKRRNGKPVKIDRKGKKKYRCRVQCLQHGAKIAISREEVLLFFGFAVVNFARYDKMTLKTGSNRFGRSFEITKY